MAATFADLFEEALAQKRDEQPNYGVRTLARHLAKGDPNQLEIIRRRLNKYRRPPGGGAAEVKEPTEGTRHEIEDALGLERDALKPEPVEALTASAEFLRDIMPLQRLWQVARMLERGELVPR